VTERAETMFRKFFLRRPQAGTAFRDLFQEKNSTVHICWKLFATRVLTKVSLSLARSCMSCTLNRLKPNLV